MMHISTRIAGRIADDFRDPHRSQVMDLLAGLEVPGSSRSLDGDERICGAILVVAGGDVERLIDAASLAQVDWRDVLMAAGLAGEDWRERLDEVLVAPSNAADSTPPSDQV